MSVRHKGSMDTLLFQLWDDEVLKVCYPHTSPKVKPNKTSRMVEGPLVLKTDSGPGRLSNSVKNIEFRQKLLDEGIFIFLGFPNGLSTTQDMDQSYAMFQPAYHRSVVCVASANIAERMLARKKSKSNREPPKAADFCLMTE